MTSAANFRINKILKCLFGLSFLLCFGGATSTAYAADLPVIPGADGWGITTPAGRGGDIYKVTNLKASGPGSLRAAVEASGPRVVLFEVSGTIVVSSDLMISNPYITIAGQTAPSPGITLRGAGIDIFTHDVLIQHLRIRVGDDSNGPNPENRDGISIDAHSQDVRNVVIDHCSISWAIDGNIDLWNTPLHDITIRSCIISEGLYNSSHPEGPHSTGILIGTGVEKISIQSNLFAHNYDRNPRILEDTTTEVVNNVVYNWSWYGSRTNSPTNIVGNYYKKGPDTLPGAKGIYVQLRAEHARSVYVSENIGPGRPNNALDDWAAVVGDERYRLNTHSITDPTQTELDANEAYVHVLKSAGARPADRDSVDVRVVESVANGSGKIIDSPKNVGGWPTLAVNNRALAIPKNPNEDDDNNGYTNLEDWLHQMAAKVEGDAPITPIKPLRPLPPYLRVEGESDE